MRAVSRFMLTLAAFLVPAVAAAQPADARHAVEVTTGYAGFVDDAPVEHFVAGGGWRWRATPRLTLGPETVYMRGPGSDRDWFVTGKLVLEATPEKRGSLYFVADGGVMLHDDDFLDGWVREGAGSFGGGVRINLSDRVYLAPEVRIGWEPHVRAVVNVGWRLP